MVRNWREGVPKKTPHELPGTPHLRLQQPPSGLYGSLQDGSWSPSVPKLWWWFLNVSGKLTLAEQHSATTYKAGTLAIKWAVEDPKWTGTSLVYWPCSSEEDSHCWRHQPSLHTLVLLTAGLFLTKVDTILGYVMGMRTDSPVVMACPPDWSWAWTGGAPVTAGLETARKQISSLLDHQREIKRSVCLAPWAAPQFMHKGLGKETLFRWQHFLAIKGCQRLNLVNSGLCLRLMVCCHLS